MSIVREIDGEEYRVIPPHEATLDDIHATVKRLEEEASKRWDHRWFIETVRYSDGDFRAHAASRHGQTEAGDVIEHRLFVNENDEVAVERYVIENHDMTHEPIEPIENGS